MSDDDPRSTKSKGLEDRLGAGSKGTQPSPDHQKQRQPAKRSSFAVDKWEDKYAAAVQQAKTWLPKAAQRFETFSADIGAGRKPNTKVAEAMRRFFNWQNDERHNKNLPPVDISATWVLAWLKLDQKASYTEERRPSPHGGRHWVRAEPGENAVILRPDFFFNLDDASNLIGKRNVTELSVTIVHEVLHILSEQKSSKRP